MYLFFYTLHVWIKKGVAIVLALFVTLQFVGITVPVIASQKSVIAYMPNTVVSIADTNALYEWRYVTQALTSSLPFNASYTDFDETNSAVLMRIPQKNLPNGSPSFGGGVSSQADIIVPDQDEIEEGVDDVVEEEDELNDTTDNDAHAREDGGDEQERVIENIEEDIESSPIVMQPDRTFVSLDSFVVPIRHVLTGISSERGETVLLSAEEINGEPVSVGKEIVEAPSLVFSEFSTNRSRIEGAQFREVSLKVSLAGRALFGASLVFEYSLGGSVWQEAGTIVFDEEQSNERNGDYFYFELRDVDAQHKIENLSVRALYRVEKEVALGHANVDPAVFIDAISLESIVKSSIFDQTIPNMFPKESDEIHDDVRTPEERRLARLVYANSIFELLKDGNASEPFRILHQKFLEESPLELSLVGASTTISAILEDNNTVRYRDVYTSTDFIYKATERGLKEEILLKDPAHPKTFTYLLNLSEFDYIQTAPNVIEVYQKGYEKNPLKKLYTISAPFMDDALGNRSESLEFIIDGDEVTLVPDAEFLSTAAYPVLVDPTVEISVLTVYAHPLSGEDWVVDFATVGTSDLYIRPKNQVTRDDISFISLYCDSEKRTAEIQAGETVYYPDWSCDGVGTVTHLVEQEGSHMLEFEFGGQTATAFNGTFTWDGGGVDNNWSTCANWTADTCPTSVDSVIFDTTSTKNVVIDVPVTVIGMSINAGYTGIISHGTNNILITGPFTQAAGTFDGGTGTLSIHDGSFTITGGTFSAPDTVLFGGTINNPYTIDVPTSLTFNNLTFDKQSNYFNIATGDSLIVNGTLTLVRGGVNQASTTASIKARGDIVQQSTFAGGWAHLDFDNDAVAQTLTMQGGSGLRLRFDADADANDQVVLTADAALFGLTLSSTFSGVFELVNPSNYKLSFARPSDTNYLVPGYYQAGGTFQGGAYTLETWNSNFTVVSGTFNAPSTTVFGGNANAAYNISVPTTLTFENLTFNKTRNTYDVASGNSLVVNATTTFQAGGVNLNASTSASIKARGNVVQKSGFKGGWIYLDLDNNDVSQTFTLEGGAGGPRLRLSSTLQENNQVVLTAPASLFGITIESGFGGTFALVNPSGHKLTLAHTDFSLTPVAGYYQAGGTFQGGAYTLETWNSNFTIVGGNFYAPSTTLFGGGQNAQYSITVPASALFESVNFTKTSNLYALSSDTVMTVVGTTTFSGAGSVNSTADTNAIIEARGDVVFASTFGTSRANLRFAGTALSGKAIQSFNLTSATNKMDGDVRINKTEGEVRLLSALVLDQANSDLQIQQGIFNINGNNVTVNGTSGTFTVSDGGTLMLNGSETITANTSYPSFTSNATAEYVGSGSYTIKDYTYGNLTISGSGTFAGNTNQTVNGTFMQASGTFTAPSGTLSVGGNFVRSGGTFTHNSGTVSLTGGNQTISGNTTFNNLSKTVSSPSTLSYTAGHTQTVLGTWTMTGTSGNILSLVSTNPGTQWQIDPQATRTIAYLSVQDSENINASDIVVNSTIANAGNNSGWAFNNAPVVSSLGPLAYVDGSWVTETAPTLTFTVSDSEGDQVRYHVMISDTADFSSEVVNYTSTLQDDGDLSFTVGQSAGGGTYSVGSSGQALSSDTQYYWRVSASDSEGATSATTTANVGNVAFGIDITAPIPGTLSFVDTTSTTTIIALAGASDASVGLATTPYVYHNQTTDIFSVATTSTQYQFTNLIPNTSYTYVVGTSDALQNSATTTSLSVRTYANQPIDLSAVSNVSTAITISWNGDDNPVTTEYYPVNITSSTTPGWISGISHQFTGLTCETTYQFNVKARNGDGIETATTTAVSGTTGACAPDASGPGGRTQILPLPNDAFTIVEPLWSLFLPQIDNTLPLPEQSSDDTSEQEPIPLVTPESSTTEENPASADTVDTDDDRFATLRDATMSGVRRVTSFGTSVIRDINMRYDRMRTDMADTFDAYIARLNDMSRFMQITSDTYMVKTQYAIDGAIREAVVQFIDASPINQAHVQTVAKIATVMAPGVIILQESFMVALFTGGFSWMNLSYILLRYLHDLLSFLHIRKRRRTWGFVYDSKTKIPLEPVLVELIDVASGKVVDSAVTDRTGQFGFVPRMGRFTIRATTAHYAFPSTYVTQSVDGAYTHVYRGEVFTLDKEHHVIAPNIPLDRVEVDATQATKGLYMAYNLVRHEWGHKIAGFIFWVGAVFVLVNLLLAFTALNITIIGFYTVLVAYRYLKWNERMWGKVVNMPELPPHTELVMEIHHRKMPEVLLARTAVSSDGKFFLKVIEPGTYVLTVKTHAVEGDERVVLEEDVAVGKDLVVNHDIYLS